MFDGYVTKILNDDEKNIFGKFLNDHGYGTNAKILYMQNKTITLDNLKKCGTIYFVNVYNDTTIYEYFLNNKYFCDTIWYYQKYKQVKMTSYFSQNKISQHVFQQTKQRLQDTFTILYYIFTKHNNVYLPELSKCVFLMYFDVIYDYKIEI